MGKHVAPVRLDPEMTTPEQRFVQAFLEAYTEGYGQSPSQEVLAGAYVAVNVVRDLFIVIDPFSDDAPEHPTYPHLH